MKIWWTLHATVLMLAFFVCPNVSGQDATNYRVWTSQDGKVRIRAKFLRFIDGKAQMAREDGSTFVTDPKNLSEDDQKLLRRLNQDNDSESGAARSPLQRTVDRERPDKPASRYSVTRLKIAENRLIYAKDILDFYIDLKKRGYVDERNAVFVESRIKEIEPFAQVDAIAFENGFVPVAELPARKQQARKLIDAWLMKTRMSPDEADFDLLIQATETHPLSLETSLLEGLYHYFHDRNISKATRAFKDAVDRGERYHELLAPYEIDNLAIALSCSAIISIRGKNIGRALAYFETITNLCPQTNVEYQLNIARMARFTQAGNVGVTMSKSEIKQGDELARKAGVQVTKRSGWWFEFPFLDQNERSTDLDFMVLQKRKGVTISQTGFEDHVCLLCDGIGIQKCPNASCKAGVVEVPTPGYRTLPDGSRIPFRYNIPKTCPTCGGDSRVTCWGCDGRGVQ